jgi:hypothetical protein
VRQVANELQFKLCIFIIFEACSIAKRDRVMMGRRSPHVLEKCDGESIYRRLPPSLAPTKYACLIP